MSPTRWVDVAVGVAIRSDGAVLLAQRPSGKPYPGWWEFPGGKVEPGESVADALARELHEELGIDVLEQSPWVVRHFVYPHASVRLFFRRVTAWRGEPHGREQQQLAWTAPTRVEVAPLLPATVPVLDWLRLPALYGISQAAELGEEAFVARLGAALAGGLRLVQLREPQLPPERFEALFYRVRPLVAMHGAMLLINSVHPASFWRAADGVHLRAADLMGARGRPAVRRVAASCHDASELAQAASIGADFAVLGPVAPTASHPASAPLGWSRFGALAEQTPVPVFALGGLGRADQGHAMRQGAHGIAARRNAWDPAGS